MISPQQHDKVEASSVPSKTQPEWRTESVSKEWYNRKLRVYMTNDVHVIDLKCPLSKPATVEVYGEFVAQKAEHPWLGWEETFIF